MSAPRVAPRTFFLNETLLQPDWQDEIPIHQSGDVIHPQLRSLGLGSRLRLSSSLSRGGGGGGGGGGR